MTLIEGHRRITPAHGMPIWDVDPFDEAILADPTDYYTRLRALGPVVYIPKYSLLALGQFETTRSVFSDHARFVSSRGVGLHDFKLAPPWRPPSIILEVDPPDHTRTRTVMARVLSPKVVRALMVDFTASAGALVEALLERGEIDGVTDLAEAFPVAVFPRAVGMTDVHPRHVVDYGACVFNAMGPDNRIRQEAIERNNVIGPWIMEACARARLTADGIGAGLYAAADAGEISAQEAGMLVRSLLSAGVDTTVTGIGNALWAFSENPGEWDRLRADPSLVRPAIEEVLRYTSPVHTFGRTANRDTDIAGFPVEEGSKVICVLGAANLDPAKWGNAEDFRIDRRPVGHLAFGVGIHGCVGQTIARGEMEALLSVMLRKLARIEPAGPPVWRPSNAIRGLERLPLRLVAATG
jgi:4-methoxybenzoate monooxygenase (O-demethylating)